MKLPKTLAVLTGGVGGAKFVLGLVHAFPDAAITAIVNTGDDFVHLGLAVSPDIDTLLYTLSGRANPVQGWGRADESWSFMAALTSLGGPDWFLLGDGDLALHVLRAQALAAGQPLSAVTAGFAGSWGIGAGVMPMTDDRVATMIDTDEGVLAFQRYFVARRCEPRALAVRFEGAADASPAPGVAAALARADAILIAPSNPYLSVDPILAVPGMRDLLREAPAPVIAVSPIVAGAAVKGPTAKLMGELGLPVTNATIARHFAGVIDGLVHDARDDAPPAPLAAAATDTLMATLADKVRVARAAVDLALSLR